MGPIRGEEGALRREGSVWMVVWLLGVRIGARAAAALRRVLALPR
jgi:hypothetical protein